MHLLQLTAFVVCFSAGRFLCLLIVLTSVQCVVCDFTLPAWALICQQIKLYHFDYCLGGVCLKYTMLNNMALALMCTDKEYVSSLSKWTNVYHAKLCKQTLQRFVFCTDCTNPIGPLQHVATIYNPRQKEWNTITPPPPTALSMLYDTEMLESERLLGSLTTELCVGERSCFRVICRGL